MLAALLRVLGIQMLARASRSWPRPVAAGFTGLMIIVSALVPILWMLNDGWGVGDVMLFFLIESIVIWPILMLKHLTIITPEDPDSAADAVADESVTEDPAGPRHPGRFVRLFESQPWVTGDASVAAFFALHYGFFTAIHTVLVTVIIVAEGLQGSLGSWAIAVATMLLSWIIDVAVMWFGQGGRVTKAPLVVGPYVRVFVMQFSTIFMLIWVFTNDVQPTFTIYVMMAVKALIDLSFLERTYHGETIEVTVGYIEPSL